MKKYSYSLDTVNWNGSFETREDAVRGAMKIPEVKAFVEASDEFVLYTAQVEVVEKNILDYFDVNEVFDMLREKAEKEYGAQAAAMYPFDQVTRESRDILEQLIAKWADDSRAHPKFTLVTDIHPNPPDMEIKKTGGVTQADIPELEEFIKDHASFVKAIKEHFRQLRPMPREARKSLTENLCNANGFIEIEGMYIHVSKVEKFKNLFLKKDDPNAPKNHAEDAQPAQTKNAAA